MRGSKSVCSNYGISLVFLLAAACSSGTDETGSTGTTAATVQAASTAETEPVRHASTSPHPVVVLWQDTAPVLHADVLKAVVANTTDHEIEIELSVFAGAPTGVLSQQALGPLTLNAQSRTPVNLNVRDLPVQSVGAAAPMQVVARYVTESPVVQPTSAQGLTYRTREASARSPVRYVTFEAGFTTATSRSLESHLVESRRLREIGAVVDAPTALRIFNPAKRSFEDVTMEASSSAAPARALVASEVPLDELPNMSDPAVIPVAPEGE